MPAALWTLALLLPTAGPPLQLHADNPHYLQFRGQPAVLITSGEHYGAVLNLDLDFLPYLDDLHARGFNLTRTFSGTYREVPGSFKIERNTLAPAPDAIRPPGRRKRASSTSTASTTPISPGSRRSSRPPASAASSSSTSCSARCTTSSSGTPTR